MVEYGLLIATIALVVLLGSKLYGNTLAEWLGRLAAHIVTTGV